MRSPMPDVPVAWLTVGQLHLLTRVAFGIASAALLYAAWDGRVRFLAIGALLMMLAGWTDRVRVARLVQARYGRLISLWQADMDATLNGGVRPDIGLLNVDDGNE